jgi:hypothetical protein
MALAINDLYGKELRLFENLFLPSVKLAKKERIGSRLRRRYEAPQTPFLSKEIDVSYPTAWLRHKIRKATADSDQRYQLAGLVEVDEGYVGGAEEGEAQKGRGAKTKSVVAVAVDRRGPSQEGQKPIPGFAALAVVPNAAASSLQGFLQSKVKLNLAVGVLSDGWRGHWRLEQQGFQHTATPLQGDPRQPVGSFLGYTLRCPISNAFCWGPPSRSRTPAPETLRRYLAEFTLPAQPSYHGDESL